MDGVELVPVNVWFPSEADSLFEDDHMTCQIPALKLDALAELTPFEADEVWEVR